MSLKVNLLLAPLFFLSFSVYGQYAGLSKNTSHNVISWQDRNINTKASNNPIAFIAAGYDEFEANLQNLRGDNSPDLCTGSLGDPIVNITFGSGNNPGKPLQTIVPGASTTYNYVPVFGNPASPIIYDGSYTITNNTVAQAAWYSGMQDHTEKDVNGYMAFFNSSATPGEFYKQTITGLCGNTKYEFAAWIANVLNPAVMTGQNPDITFSIEDVNGNKIASFATGAIQQANTFTWNKYGFFFQMPHGISNVVLKIINSNPGGDNFPGNDFALDDITFRACGPQLGASFDANTFQDKLSICAGKTFTLYGDVTTQGHPYDYLWQVSKDRGLTWSDLPNSNTISISLIAPNDGGGKSSLYRMLSAELGNINSKNCRVVSNVAALDILRTCTEQNTIIPSFTILDTVCVNTPVHITNTTSGASSYYWSFCTADLKNEAPLAENVGNIGGTFSQPVFMDLVSDNGKYYAFLTNHYPGGLVRLDFGNSYLNTPVATSFGNFGGIIPTGYGTEGIQVVKNEGKWYAIVVAGSTPNNVPSRVIKIEFGTSIENPSPIATDWGNIGDLSTPVDFYMFKDGEQWYGFTVNALNNTISRIAFTSSFSNVPTGTNLSNVSNMLDYPTGVHAINNEGKWSLFVTNANSNKLVRLDFGSSLLNEPTAIDLGSFNNILNAPRDITILKSCKSLVGYIVNGNGDDIVQLDFNNNFNNVPTGKSLGNIGSLNFPHSISKLFRVNNDLYSFITNVNNNTITRLKFAGCTNSSIAGSSLQNPPNIVYNKSGTYNITLSVDEGLATQSSTCRQVVVIAPPAQHPTLDTAFCEGGNVNLISLSTSNSYLWNTGANTSSINVSGKGKYWVTTDAYGCKSTDSFHVSTLASPVPKLGNDTAICKGDSLIVFAKNTGSTYLWQDGSTADNFKITKSGVYSIAVTNTQGCIGKDTISVDALLSPALSGLQDKTICKDDVAQLSVTASGNSNSFTWQPDATLSALNIANPTAAPTDITKYYVFVKNENGCVTKDSVRVNVLARPTITVRTDTTICSGGAVTLTASAENATVFNWSPSQNLSNHILLSPVAAPATTTTYSIAAGNGVCNATDEITINVKQPPTVAASNDTIICGTVTAQLFAIGANSYTWYPTIGLTNSTISNPIASPSQTITYHVKGTGENGCINEDSVKITVAAPPSFTINPSKSEVCLGDSELVTSSGGDVYIWDPSPDILQPFQASTYIKPTTAGIYKVVVINNTCKIKDTLYTTFSIAPKPVIQVNHSNDIDCTVNTATLIAIGASNYEWTPSSTLTNPNSASPLATPNQTTIYHVKATGVNGCVTEDSVTVKVKVENSDNAYQMASAFTPNKDGINDCFGVKKWSLVNDLDFSIYDRWGVLIFHGDKVSDCWDGTYKGLPQATGAYIYVIKAKTFCGNTYKKGTVVLIR